MRAGVGTGDPVDVRARWSGRHRTGRRAAAVGAVLVFVAVSLTACLPPGAVLQGRVTDVGAGPIAGVSVRVYSSATETLVTSTVTDADGDYSFTPEDLADGAYRILYSEHDWWEGATAWADATDVTVADGTTRRIDVTIDAAKGSIAGTVTDGSAPLDGVSVTVRTSSDDRAVATGTTGPGGTYTVGDVPVGSYRVQFSLTGYTTRYSNAAPTAAAAPVLAVAEGETLSGVDTTLASEARVTGVLTDGMDPVAGGFVVVYDLDHNAWATHLTTGIDGTFAVANLNPGRYSVGFFDPATGTFGLYGSESDDPADGAPITVAAGSHVDLGTLVLGTAFYAPTAPVGVTATPGDLQATVTWEPPAADGGAAVSGYTVTASPGGQTCTTAETTCVVTGLTNGTPVSFAVAATNAIGQGPVAVTDDPVTPNPSAQWLELVPAVYDAPSPRGGAGVVALTDGRALLHGGLSQTEPNEVEESESWIWDGATWSALASGTTPGPRFGATMSELPGGGAVLFGGAQAIAPEPEGDTWVFDGTSWTLIEPSVSPPARMFGSMTTLSNGDVLLFGGTGQDGVPMNDTWTFDGTTWTQLPTGPAPTGRNYAGLAALPGGDALLFGGHLGGLDNSDETWIFDGTDWQLAEPADAPSPRAGMVTATLDDGRVLLFGGATTAGAYDDTWIFDGSTWTEPSPETVPPARYMAGGATLTGGDVLVFGGIDLEGDVPTDTWTYDGSDWTRHHDIPHPPATVAGALTALPDGDVLLFGGADTMSYDTIYDGTWRFDGASWTEVVTEHSPEARAGASMVTLPGGDVLLFGGFDPSHGSYGDTWVFDGDDWTELEPAGSPPALSYASMVTLSTGDIVLFGGVDIVASTVSDETWTFDGTSWSMVTTSSAPPARMGATLTGSSAGGAVLFGGFDYSTAMGDTWFFTGGDWVEATPMTSPPARMLASAAPLGDGSVLLYGGTDAGFTDSYADVWIFDGTTWTRQADGPPARTAAAMTARPDGSVLLLGGVEIVSEETRTDIWIRTP